MKAIVQLLKNDFYAIRYGKEFIIGALGEPLRHRSKDVMEVLR